MKKGGMSLGMGFCCVLFLMMLTLVGASQSVLASNEKVQDELMWPAHVQEQLQATTDVVRARLQNQGVDLSGMFSNFEGGMNVLQSPPNTLSTTVLTIAVSTALDPDYLQSLSKVANRIGARLVVRGFPVHAERLAKSYWQATPQEQRAQKQVIAQGIREIGTLSQCIGCAPIAVDPVFFRTHDINEVPAFVLTDHRPNAGMWTVRVRGAVTLDVALNELLTAVDQAKVGVNEKKTAHASEVNRLTHMHDTLNGWCQSLWGRTCAR